jgi:hypothetical protein
VENIFLNIHRLPSSSFSTSVAHFYITIITTTTTIITDKNQLAWL